MFYDAAAGIYLTRSRAYNPKTGRFLQRDILDETGKDGKYKGFPFGKDAIGSNLYAWCGNNPASKVDPSGQNGLWDFVCAAAAVVYTVCAVIDYYCGTDLWDSAWGWVDDTWNEWSADSWNEQNGNSCKVDAYEPPPPPVADIGAGVTTSLIIPGYQEQWSLEYETSNAAFAEGEYTNPNIYYDVTSFQEYADYTYEGAEYVWDESKGIRDIIQAMPSDWKRTAVDTAINIRLIIQGCGYGACLL